MSFFFGFFELDHIFRHRLNLTLFIPNHTFRQCIISTAPHYIIRTGSGKKAVITRIETKNMSFVSETYDSGQTHRDLSKSVVFIKKFVYVPLTSYRPTFRFFFPNHIFRQLSDVSEDMRTDGMFINTWVVWWGRDDLKVLA